MKTAEKIQRKPRTLRSGNGKTKSARVGNDNGKGTPNAPAKKLVVEMYGGEPYEYYPLGKYVVAAPGVCGGRPTFKYTRIDVKVVLEALAGGWTMERVVDFYQRREVPRAAIREAILLANRALLQTSSVEAMTP